MSIAAVSNSGLSGSYGAAAAPVAVSSAVRNTSDGAVIETLGRLKVSEIDGKNVTSMYSSGSGEGEVLSTVKLGGGNAPAQPAPDLYPNEVQNRDAAPAPQFGGSGSAAPAPTSVPTAAATVAYQAVSGFGGGAAPAFSATA